MFAFLIYGVLATSFFAGALRGSCVDKVSGMVSDPQIFCFDNNPCPSSMTCDLDYGNPFYGFANFDNFGYAVLTLFENSTGEGWIYRLYSLMQTGLYLAPLFYVTMMIIVNLLIFNFFLAVVRGQFAVARASTRSNTVHEDDDYGNTEDEEGSDLVSTRAAMSRLWRHRLWLQWIDWGKIRIVPQSFANKVQVKPQ